jgi:2-phosphosulfolactate phosphatase
MNIDLTISADDTKSEKVEDKSVVVIDMLRATSVIATALSNGCQAVIPVLTVEEAIETAGVDRGTKYLLGGERKGLKIEGFDLANSPREYIREAIAGKTLIMTTTNGTRAIRGSRGARHILIGAVINASAVAERLMDLDDDVVLVNAGTYGQFSLDDFLCSGYLIDCLKSKVDVRLTDIATTAHYVYKNNEDIFSFIKYARHYQRLMELNLAEDLRYCCQKDIIDTVPEYRNGVIK